jgi:hypothetical protein
MFGGNDNDTLIGGAGADGMNGEDGADSLEGGTGNDILSGGSGNDLLNGGEDDDRITGGGDNDTLIGGDGNDTLEGDAGADLVDGGAGNDVIQLGGLDVVTTGTGADQVTISHNTVASNAGNRGRVTDFQQGQDKIFLTFQSGVGKDYVFNDGNQNFGPLSTSGPNQTILGNGGDTLHDVFYSKSADGLTTTLIVDVNDDGKLDGGDVVVTFDGSIDFTQADFTASSFNIVRGTPATTR